MVIFLTTPIGAGHIQGLIRRYDPSQSRYFQEMTYADLVRRGRAPRGTAYVFTDRQRMSEPFLRVASELWRQLESAGGVRLFSKPESQMTRFDLMRKLAETGVNAFNVYRPAEFDRANIRYPVFLRLDNDHSGPKSPLIGDRDRLVLETKRLIAAGIDPRQIIAVEFLRTCDEAGIYRKYGAMRIGDRVICQHVLLGKDWNVKADVRIRTDEAMEESDDFFRANPHAKELRSIFESSGIEFGRADYALANGRIQIWEINDNPVIAGGPWRSDRLRNMTKLDKGPTWFSAFSALAEGIPRGPEFDLDLERLAGALRGEALAP